MKIRKAVKEDAEYIAPFLLLAMKHSIYEKLDDKDYEKAKDLLRNFVEKEKNQYSYQNCLVAEEKNEVIGVVNIYDGARLNELRKPVAEYIRAKYNKDLELEDETQAGEYYIDSVGVNPNHQGKGAGSKMLEYVIHEYANKNQQTLGLLVGEDNEVARRVYFKLGFKPVGKKLLRGKDMEHLQLKAE